MILENIRIALKAIRANKMRSILTTLGIVIGVASVIAVVSIVQGLDYAISNEFKSVGATFVMVFPIPEDPTDPDLAGRELALTYEDGLAVMEEATAVTYYSPVFQGRTTATHRGKARTVAMLGVGPGYQEVSNHWVERGRFFSQLDIDRHAPVCLIGKSTLRSLALGKEPLGAEIGIEGGTCTVVGVLETKGSLFGQNQDDVLVIPITTAQDVYGKALRNLQLNFQAESPEVVEQAKDQIKDILRRRHHIADGKPADFTVFLQEEILKSVGKMLGIVTAVVASVVGIALLVGGIGIMNVMLVSVTERTREIGIRKAVGARSSDILVQFLMEAVTLSAAGGLAGIALGSAIGIIGSRFIPDFPPAHVPLWAVVLAFGFAGLVGVIFGTYPAVKAAALDPIEALRYE